MDYDYSMNIQEVAHYNEINILKVHKIFIEPIKIEE